MLVFESSSRLPAYTADRAFQLLLSRLALEAGVYRDIVSELEELLKGSRFWERATTEGRFPDLVLEDKLREALGADFQIFRNRWEVLELAAALPEFRGALELLAESLPEETPDWIRILEDSFLTAKLLLVD